MNMKLHLSPIAKRWLVVPLLVIATMSVARASVKIGDLYYELNTSTRTAALTYENKTTTNYASLPSDLVIPSTVTYSGLSYTVTSIENYAFANCTSITSITIPATIKQIGTTASGDSSSEYHKLSFYKATGLKKVVIEDGSTTLILSARFIASSNAEGKGAFGYSPLEEVYLGRNISYNEVKSSVNDYSFASHPSYYGYSAFYNQSKLVKITIGESVTEIIPYLFYENTSLTVTTLPHVKTIGDWAFANCTKLATLNLGDAITKIGNSAFRECNSITKLTFPNTLNTIGSNAFNGCTSVTEITVGSGLTTIGASAFYGCSSFTALILPDQFTTMGASAFENCTKLTIARLGQSITAIPARAFKNCTSLSEMTIPGTATSIGNQAFYNDSGLAMVTMNEGLETIGDEVFWNNSGIMRFIIPGTVTSIGKNCFYGCTNVTYLILRDGQNALTINNASCRSSIIDAKTSNSTITNRHNDYFYDCPIRFLTLGRNLRYAYEDGEEIYDWNGSSFTKVTRASAPFINKTELRSVTIGPYVTYLYPHLFEGCTELANLTMGPNIKSIYSYAFKNCDKLTSIDFPVTLQLIDNYAFHHCNTLASTTFIETSDRTLSINKGAFKNCVALQQVTFPGNLVSLGESAYQSCIALHTTIFNNSTIPDNQLVLNNYAFSGCSTLQTVRFPNHLYKILDYVYEKCPSLQELSFPANLISIGNYVFADTRFLTNIQFEDSNQPITVGYGAIAAGTTNTYSEKQPLFGNSSLSSLYIGRNITYNAVGTNGYSPFYNQTWLTDVRFSQAGTVTYCHDYLLYYVNKCQQLLLPESLQSIGNYTFSNMSQLSGITIPNNVSSIGVYAFSCDKLLKYAKLSTGCSWLKEGVFSGCDVLESITIPPVVTQMDTRLFANCKELATVTFEGGSDLIQMGFGCSDSQYGLFYDCPVVTLNLDRWLSYDTQIYMHAPFESIATLKNLNIGANVGVIDKYMFCYCTGLEEVYLPDNIESVGLWGFRGCTSLEKVRFSQKLRQVGDYGFSGCTMLDNVVFPESMTSVADYSFSDCTSLKKLDLGNKLQIIGPAAFKNDTALDGIIIPETLYGLGVESFANCTSLPNVTIRAISSVGKQAFENCTGLEWVSLSDKTTSLGQNSFSGCTGIKWVKSYAEFPPEGLVNFPESVVSTGTLYVPQYSIDYYRYSPTWENWYRIEQINDIAITSVTINETEAIMNVGDNVQLTATILPANATNQVLTWASSNPDVATVNQNGMVTALSQGTATITATTTDGSHLSVACAVTVKSVPVTSVTVSPSSLILQVGGTQQLTATVQPSNATNPNVSWDSSNPMVATVDESGVVTAKAAGTATITGTAQDGSGKKGNCTVTVTAGGTDNLPRLTAPELTFTLADAGKVKELPLTLTMPTGGNYTNIEVHLTYPNGVKPARVNTNDIGDLCLDYDDGWWTEAGSGVTMVGRPKSPCVSFTDNFDTPSNWPTYTIVGANMTQTANTANPNHVLTVYVTVDEANFSKGNRDMLAYVKYTDTSNRSYSFGNWDQYDYLTTFHFGGAIRGDVNGNGVVDVDDLNIVINIMVRKATLDRWPAADLDANGVVDVDDLNHVINIMVKKE